MAEWTIATVSKTVFTSWVRIPLDPHHFETSKKIGSIPIAARLFKRRVAVGWLGSYSALFFIKEKACVFPRNVI